ncbi:unnamed protein product [Hyaloperonospora brassicae]|uniref:RxLR effector candidate protein n=1 Tax=Hyaloperonospora brassicae TaxID=162125 RepID=A0AAV0TKE1_HYABA|nr:unnamed protein product [Hyaloperonospora brassicae]
MTTTTKRRMFPTSSMRSSATASSAAAVSAAFRLKSNLSTATKLPIARQRPTAIRAGTVPDGSTAVREECPVKSLARSHTESAAGKQHDQAKTASQRFAMSSIMRLRTVSKDKVHSKLAAVTHLKKSHGGRLKRCTSTNSSGTYADSEEEAELNGECTSSKAHKSAMTSASRFVKGMPTMLRRAVSTNNPLDEAQTSPFDGSDCYTPQDETATDDTEDDRQSLLLMLQVPQTRRYSQLPLMAASEGW